MYSTLYKILYCTNKNANLSSAAVAVGRQYWTETAGQRCPARADIRQTGSVGRPRVHVLVAGGKRRRCKAVAGRLCRCPPLRANQLAGVLIGAGHMMLTGTAADSCPPATPKKRHINCFTGNAAF